jgi:hypothetical protein
MTIKTVIFTLAAVTLLASCKHASFQKQRYTHNGHSKPVIQQVAISTAPYRVVRHEQIKPAQVEVKEVPGQFTASPAVVTTSIPVRNIQSSGALVVSADKAAGLVANNGRLVNIKEVKTRIGNVLKSNVSDSIPIISPILKIIMLLLLIALVAGIIFLVILL